MLPVLFEVVGLDLVKVGEVENRECSNEVVGPVGGMGFSGSDSVSRPPPHHLFQEGTTATASTTPTSTTSPRMTTAKCTFEDESTQTDLDSGHSAASTASSADDDPPYHPRPSCSSHYDASSSSSSESVMEILSRKVSQGLVLFRPSSLDQAAPGSSRRRCDQGTQTDKDALVSQTEALAFDVIQHFALAKRSSTPGDEVTKCLRCSVQKMLEKHSITFNGMMSRLQIDQNCDFREGFNTMAEELFTLNKVSWGKIIALFAFGARLAQHCQSNGMEDRVMEIAANLAQFANKKLTPFLKEHGGWATLCDAFPTQNDYESKIWKSLIIAGFGLTTIAAIVAMQR